MRGFGIEVGRGATSVGVGSTITTGDSVAPALSDAAADGGAVALGGDVAPPSTGRRDGAGEHAVTATASNSPTA